jgi:hypothetical protein
MLADGIPGRKHTAREGLADDSDGLLNLVSGISVRSPLL